jgi:integrase
VKAGKYSPNTVNYWWAFFKMVMREACIEFDLKDPTRGFPNITNGGYRVYTLEEPNSLTIEELPGFFDMARKHERTHYAMLALGVLTGRRPCELRPLRWRGKDPDLNWETGALVIRRSQTLGEPMESTKQKREVGAWLSPQMMEILRRHVVEIRGFRKSSDLLFPGFRSEYLSPVALQKPIRHICRLAGIKKRITPTGAMRRTYQDLCRQASVSDTVQRAMSGHATIEMKEWYSTLGEVEGRTALVRMASIAGID